MRAFRPANAYQIVRQVRCKGSWRPLVWRVAEQYKGAYPANGHSSYLLSSKTINGTAGIGRCSSFAKRNLVSGTSRCG